MGKELTAGITAVLLAIVGVAVIAVIVSNNAKSASVIKAGGTSFASALSCALSPLTGAGGCGTSVSSTISFG